MIATDLRKDSSTLGRTLKGLVLHSGEPGYDDARRLWNAKIDSRPALVVPLR